MMNTPNIRFQFSLLLSCILLGSTAMAQKANENSSQPPNIVLIVIDDIGYGDLGIYGHGQHNTPNINRLARKGMIFSDFHTNGSVCSPTRAALMTGQYQQRSGVERAIGFNKEEGIPLNKRIFAEGLQEKGYKTGVFGKWHLGHVEFFGPNFQGFDKSVVSNNSPDYHTHMSRVGELDWYEDHELNNESGYLTDLVSQHSLDFVDENKENPFFLYVSHIALHFPFQGPTDPPLRTEGKIWHDVKYGPLPESQYRRAYLDMLESVDNSIGELMSKLESLNLDENTLVFITSDNGAYPWVGSNYPLRGGKGNLFEGGHRVPAIAYWPGQIAEGVVESTTLMTMDLAPTFLSLANASSEEDNFDGMDFSPLLSGQTMDSKRTLFWRTLPIRSDNPVISVRRGDWKYMEDENGNYLFNLSLDITESNNLIKEYPQRAAKMAADYNLWSEEVLGEE
ncbi:sulfatase-like hydrolase/transferase [Membranihabitans marinus]|uniref:sulfatase-like hydrolase/transferase n=1 Tax=Membranihabitans marinus TaxID=1227546 RepID=UPI001F014E0E|nr:sulfatase-like hydrolase/transferase [Membranihabitans marinus]